MDAIRAAIPHREPFLFVDEILEQGPDLLRTRWRVPPEAARAAGDDRALSAEIAHGVDWRTPLRNRSAFWPTITP